MSTGFGKYLNENSCPVPSTIWAVPLQVGCWVFQVGGRLQTEGWSCFLAADSPTLPRKWGGLRGTEIQEVSAWGEWSKYGDRGQGSPGTVREEPWTGWGLGSLALWPLSLTWPEPSPGPEWTSKASGRLGPWTLESVASFPSSWDLSCRPFLAGLGLSSVFRVFWGGWISWGSKEHGVLKRSLGGGLLAFHIFCILWNVRVLCAMATDHENCVCW